MENVLEKPRGLVTRISTLLNNVVCSDVVFHVRHKEETTYYYAHSPVLIVAGKGFPDLGKQSYETKAIKISDFAPLIVEMMLTYIYTDELNILTLDNAVDLYKLSQMYGIDDLVKLCGRYIAKEEVNIDNLFVQYKSALSCNFPDLLEKCRHLVQSETKAIFSSRYFGEAPFSVVEDILSLDNLNIASEFEVIKAAFQWSACECRRKGRPTDKRSLRNAIEPLLKHLRFLSFSADEFSDCTSKYGNIFTASETAILNGKILQPNYEELPENLCSISKPRQPYHKTSNHIASRINSTDFYSGYTNNILTNPYFEKVGENALKGLYSGSVHKITFRDSYDESANKNASISSNSGPFHWNNFFYYCDAQKVHSNIFNRNSPNHLLSKINSRDYPPESTNENASKSSNSGPVHRIHFFDYDAQKVQSNIFNRNSSNNLLSKINSNDYHPESTNENNSGNSSFKPLNNLKSGQEGAFLFSQNLDRGPLSSKVQLKSVFEYNHEKAKPVLKVMLQAIPSRQTFDFPLQEVRKSIGFASSKDIKCNAKIQMQAGVIFIHGIELKISEQNHNPYESIEVLSCITNNNPPKYDMYSLKLKNSILSITYPEPFMVDLENPLDIEITVEDLILNRCFVCLGRTFELNCGLNAKAEISVKSNQYYGQDNVLYLINRIFYSVVS